MMKILEFAIKNKVKVILVTRPIEDYQIKDISALQETFETLKDVGISLVYKTNICRFTR